MKNTVLARVGLGISALSLASCGGEAEQAEQVEQMPDGVPGLNVSDARMVLNPVSGNPAAIYFNLSYGGDKRLQVRRVDVLDAESAMFHGYMDYNFEVQMMETGPFLIEKNQTLEFKPGGEHVMAMNVSPELKPGGKTEATLTIAGGDKFSFPVEVRAAGDER